MTCPGCLAQIAYEIRVFCPNSGMTCPGCFAQIVFNLRVLCPFFLSVLLSLDDLSRVSCPNSICSNRRREGEVRQGVLPKSTWRWDDLSRVSRPNSIKVRMTCSGYLSEIVYKVGCFTRYVGLGWLVEDHYNFQSTAKVENLVALHLTCALGLRVLATRVY